MNETLDRTNLTLRDRLKAAVESFGLPRLIIAGFLLLLFIAAPIVGAKALVLEALRGFNRESGVTVVMISSELEELRSICDRIAIVSGGRIAGILPATDSPEDFGMLMVSMVK